MAEVTPITLLIGFPGAGKTTLLHQLRDRPVMADVAVVSAQPDPPMSWTAGCPCCAPRDDVARGLRALLPRVRRDEVRQVVIETTGLADPGPILATLLADTVAASAYRLDSIVAVVDAVRGAATLHAHDRAARQIAVADRVLLTRTERGDAGDLPERLRRLNPGAPIVVVPPGAVDPATVLNAGLSAPGGRLPDLRNWLNAEAFVAADQPGAQPGYDTQVEAPGCDARRDAFCLTSDQPLAWPAVSAWLERLILTHGDALLRMKGVLHIPAQAGPVVVHSIGHLLHPPRSLPAWPVGDKRLSRLMFVTRDLPRRAVQAGLPFPADIALE